MEKSELLTRCFKLYQQRFSMTRIQKEVAARYIDRASKYLYPTRRHPRGHWEILDDFNQLLRQEKLVTKLNMFHKTNKGKVRYRVRKE